MYDLFKDLRLAARMLRKTPGVAAVAIVSLAFAIAINTSTFSISKGFLFETFRWEEPERVALVYEVNLREADSTEVAPGNFLDWSEASTHFQQMVAYTVRPANLTGGDEPERLNVVEATEGLFALLGRYPTLGRDFLPEEASPSANRVAILSAEFFEREFGGDPAALGQALTVDGEPHTVVGVVPPELDFLPANVQMFRPIDLSQERHDRDGRAYLVLARLRDGSDFVEAEVELQTLAKSLEQQYPDSNRGYGVNVETLREVFPGEVDTRLQYILMSVAGFVLIIACANLVNIFLFRADSRQTEVALRTALGAGRLRIARQHLMESLLISAVGGLIGVGLSFAVVRSMGGAMPAELPSVFWPEVDGTVLAFGVLASLAAGCLLGTAPALQAMAVDPASSLGETSRGGTVSKRRRRLRSGFIVAETAAALALLTAAGVLTATFRDVVQENGDINVDGLLTVELTADESRHADDAAVTGFYREVLRRVAEVPGVSSAAALAHLPRSRAYSSTSFTVDGEKLDDPSEAPTSGWQSVSQDYFSTLEVTLQRGRYFNQGDRADAPPVVVINDSLARRSFPDVDPVGRRITVLGASREIVGVAADFNQPRISAEEGFPPAIYLPFEQQPIRTMSLALRTDADPMSLVDPVRDAVWAVDPDQPVSLAQTLRHHIETELSGPRVIGQSLTVIGAAALLLSAIGMFGLISYDVGQRRREIGIRMAMGAAPAQVVRGVALQGMTITGLGLLVGVPLAWGMIRAIGATFQELAPVHWATLAGLVGLLVAVSAVASYLPARRASRIHPSRVLQMD